MLTTSFYLAKRAGACKTSYRKFAKHVGGIRKYGRHTPIPLTEILDVLGTIDALWCFGAVPKHQAMEADMIYRAFNNAILGEPVNPASRARWRENKLRELLEEEGNG